MGRDRVSGSDRGTAESLLRGDSHHAAAGDALVHLLAAATAPARAYELVGEETAVAAFRQSHGDPVHDKNVLPSGRKPVSTATPIVPPTVGVAGHRIRP